MQRLDMLESNKNADEKEIQTLQAALEAYKRSTRPTSSVPLTPAVIQPYVDTTVIPQMRDALREALEEVYTQLQKTITEREGQIYATVWEKLRLTMSMVDTVSARLDKDPKPSKGPSAKLPIPRPSSASSMPPPTTIPDHVQTSLSTQ